MHVPSDRTYLSEVPTVPGADPVLNSLVGAVPLRGLVT